MNSMSATAKIQNHILPNWPARDHSFRQWTSSQFYHLNGIWHIHVPLYHPSSNGLAECVMQTFKKGIKKQSEAQFATDFLASYLLIALLVKHPLEYHQLSCRWADHHALNLHLLTPSLPQRIEQKQDQQKLNHDKRAIDPEQSFTEGEKVYGRNYCSIGKKLLPGDLLSVAQQSVNRTSYSSSFQPDS